MRSGTIAFTAGVWCLQQLSQLPAGWWLATAPLFLFLLIKPPAYPLNHLITTACLGFLWALFHASYIAPPPLPADLEGKELIAEGMIDSLPVHAERLTRFEFRPNAVFVDDRQVDYRGRIRLSWYGSHPQLAAGQYWRLKIKLKRAHGMFNPGGFDYESWLYQRGIRATGYVRKGAENERFSNQGFGLGIQTIRESLRGALERTLTDHPQKGLIIGLAIGERYGISQQQWQVLRVTGTSHLLAISGLHIGLVSALLYLFTFHLWRLFPVLLHHLPAVKVAAISAVVGALVYAALAGFTIPTRRAFIMVAVVMLSQLLDRPSSPSRTLAFALLLVVIVDPLSVLAAGFWLSFGAVAMILFGMGNRTGQGGLFWRWGRVHFLVVLGLLPLLGLFFQQFSLSSPLANLIAVPWVGFAVVPLVLLGTLLFLVLPQVATLLINVAAYSLQQCWNMLSWLSELLPPYSVAEPSGLWFFIAMCGVVWILTPRGWPARWLGAVAVLPLLLHQQQLPYGAYRFTLLDVGQGLASVVQTANHTLVYDTGPRFSAHFDTGSAVIVPYLRSQGINRLDLLVVSHGDNDHMGGARTLLNDYPDTPVLTSAGSKMDWINNGSCHAGQSWEWDGVAFEMLNPLKSVLDTTKYQGNESTCVLKVTAHAGSVLLTGDIGRVAETGLVKSFPEKLESLFMTAPHHGSKTSSTRAFLQRVKPRWLLVSSGYRNRFGFPHPTVTNRYREMGIEVMNTANDGAITVDVGREGGMIKISSHREQTRRYWHAPPDL